MGSRHLINTVLSNPITSVLADVAAVATGNPELIPLINGGLRTAGGIANGESIGKSLGQGAISGATSFAGSELAGAAANYFPETAASLGYSNAGGNSLTDLLGRTSGAGSLAGAGTIGGDLTGNYAAGSGLDKLFGSGAATNSGGALSSLLRGGASGVSSDGLNVGQAYDTASLNGFSPSAGSGFGTGSGLTGEFAHGLGGSAYTPVSTLGSALSTGSGGGASSFGGVGNAFGIGSTLLGAANSLSANDKAQKDLLNANNAALAQLAPYQATGEAANTRLSELLGTGGNPSTSDYGSLTKAYTPQDLQNDPGYQFQLQQGNQALDRAQASRGGYFSGAALKAAQDYGTGLADQTYRDAFARNQSQNQQTYGELAGQSGQGASASGAAANINQNTGLNQANAGISTANTINQSLSSLLNGSGARRRIVGSDGQVYYV